VLKVSGESFGQRGQAGISMDETVSFAQQAKRVVQRGVELAIVVGGGNILRGQQFSAGGTIIKEATAHYMGMLATSSTVWRCKRPWKASSARRVS